MEERGPQGHSWGGAGRTLADAGTGHHTVDGSVTISYRDHILPEYRAFNPFGTTQRPLFPAIHITVDNRNLCRVQSAAARPDQSIAYQVFLAGAPVLGYRMEMHYYYYTRSGRCVYMKYMVHCGDWHHI